MRGSLVSSGKITVQALTQNKDMDFEKLLNYLQDNLDLLWRIPPQKLRGTSAKTRVANPVLRPYFARIKKEQKLVEDLLNAQFFAHFGRKFGDVKIKLSNSASVDQVTDVTWTSLMYHDGVLSMSEYRDRMGLPTDTPVDLEENPYKQQIAITNETMANPPEQNSGAPNPNKGKTTDNRANPNKTPKQTAEGK